MADVGIPDDDLDPEANELSLIDMENAMLTTGEIVEVEDFHNHDLHIVHQNQLRLSPQWSSYSDDVKGAIEGHLRTHIFKQEAVERAEEARMMAMQAQQAGIMAPSAPLGKVGHPPDLGKPDREINEPLMEK
jgi:hypothetical protein